MAKKKSTSKKRTTSKKTGPGFKGYVGAKTGKTVAEYWAYLFAMQPKNKLTNKQLSNAMHEEFPNAKRYSDRDVIVFRNRYNNGNLLGQAKAPANRVGEYVECPHCHKGVRVKGWGEKNRRGKAKATKKKASRKKASTARISKTSKAKKKAKRKTKTSKE